VEESGGQKQADIASQLLSSNSCLAALARKEEERGEKIFTEQGHHISMDLRFRRSITQILLQIAIL